MSRLHVQLPACIPFLNILWPCEPLIGGKNSRSWHSSQTSDHTSAQKRRNVNQQNVQRVNLVWNLRTGEETKDEKVNETNYAQNSYFPVLFYKEREGTEKKNKFSCLFQREGEQLICNEITKVTKEYEERKGKGEVDKFSLPCHWLFFSPSFSMKNKKERK